MPDLCPFRRDTSPGRMHCRLVNAGLAVSVCEACDAEWSREGRSLDHLPPTLAGVVVTIGPPSAAPKPRAARGECFHLGRLLAGACCGLKRRHACLLGIGGAKGVTGRECQECGSFEPV